jgi:hypothetical protein
VWCGVYALLDDTIYADNNSKLGLAGACELVTVVLKSIPDAALAVEQVCRCISALTGSSNIKYSVLTGSSNIKYTFGGRDVCQFGQHIREAPVR